MFLENLLIAMRRRASLAVFSGLPSITEIMAVAPPDFTTPAAQLLHTLSSITVAAPFSEYTVERDHVAAFSAVITDVLYDTYADSAAIIDHDGWAPLRRFRLKQTARALTRRYPELLSLKRTRVGLLKPLPSLIDLWAGKIAGQFVKLLVDLITGMRDEHRQIAIYDFSALVMTVMEPRRQLAIERRGPMFGDAPVA